MFWFLLVSFFSFAFIQFFISLVDIKDHVSRWRLLLVCFNLLDCFKFLIFNFIHGWENIIHRNISSMFLLRGNDLLIILNLFGLLRKFRSRWWWFDNNWSYKAWKCKVLIGSCCLKSLTFNQLLIIILSLFFWNLWFQFNFIPSFGGWFSYLFAFGLTFIFFNSVLRRSLFNLIRKVAYSLWLIWKIIMRCRVVFIFIFLIFLWYFLCISFVGQVIFILT